MFLEVLTGPKPPDMGNPAEREEVIRVPSRGLRSSLGEVEDTPWPQNMGHGALKFSHIKLFVSNLLKSHLGEKDKTDCGEADLEIYTGTLLVVQ